MRKKLEYPPPPPPLGVDLVPLACEDAYPDISFKVDFFLSHDIASGSDITPCNVIDKPLVVHRFNNVTY